MVETKGVDDISRSEEYGVWFPVCRRLPFMIGLGVMTVGTVVGINHAFMILKREQREIVRDDEPRSKVCPDSQIQSSIFGILA